MYFAAFIQRSNISMDTKWATLQTNQRWHKFIVLILVYRQIIFPMIFIDYCFILLAWPDPNWPDCSIIQLFDHLSVRLIRDPWKKKLSEISIPLKFKRDCPDIHQGKCWFKDYFQISINLFGKHISIPFM